MGMTEGEVASADLSSAGAAMTFAARHIGPDADAQTQMLKAIGYASLEALMDAAIPEVIRWHGTLELPAAASE